MNTSRFVLTQLTSGRSDGKTFSYHGRGYTYYLHKTSKDIWAKLQIARQTMKKFLAAVGLGENSPRTLQSLHGISVCEQGVGGWYDIFVLDERKLLAVINFIKKLNRFMNAANVIGSPSSKYHYFVEARRFEHAPPRRVREEYPKSNVTRPIAFQSVLNPVPIKQNAPVGRLQMLAQTVNTRYGH